MHKIVMLGVILIPMIAAALIPLLPFRSRRAMLVYLETAVVVNSALVLLMLFNRPEDALTVFRFTGNLSITLRVDGLGALFAGMSAVLWPPAMLYSFEYMKHENREKSFFAFYLLTYGVTLGVALAENILTMYFFFEMLSLITVPLVMHTHTKEAVHASCTYMYYMLGGAAFAFIGMIFILTYGGTSSFVAGGVLDLERLGGRSNMLLLVYFLCFCGFSVKTAMWPFSSWLPRASVAPTPVTALLHAVAVVNTGAFAIMRVTYFSFGVEALRGTWAQYAALSLVIVTIVYGCSRALKEPHIKRRLAWSTVSNLSYVLFGAALMTPLGLTGAMAHMLFHSFMKICAFFCAGAVMYKTGRNYIYELNGLGRKMPGVFVIFTVCAFALMGVPGFCGFVSKWSLAKAAVDSESTPGYLGVAALLVSALLTAVYMLTIPVRAFSPGKEAAGSGSAVSDSIGGAAGQNSLREVSDPGWMMMAPLVFFLVVMLAFGLCSGPVVELLGEIAATAW